MSKPGKKDDPKEQELTPASMNGVIETILFELEKKHGYVFSPRMGGSIANHDVYIKSEVPFHSGTYYLRKLSTRLDFRSYSKRVEHLITAGIKWDEETDEKQLAWKLLPAFTYNVKDNRSPLARRGEAECGFGDTPLTTSYNGQLAHKAIPRRHWFPQLAELNPLELLSLFPEPEARLFMLVLGRALIGKQHSNAEGNIDHAFRTAAVVVGFEPGLGKSTLLNYLRTALHELGYNSFPIGETGTRFGWGTVAETDLAFKDDMTDKLQKNLLCNEVLKTIITGGEFNAELKGVNSYTVQANAAVVCLTNCYNPYHFADMDSGSLDRWRFLYTYNRKELESKYSYDARTEPNWKRLAEKYKVNINDLACYLLACSAEYLVEQLGYELQDGCLNHTREDQTEQLVETLSQQLVLAPNLRHVDALVESAAHWVALSIAKSEDDELAAKALKALPEVSFNYRLLANLVNVYALADNSNQPWVIPQLDRACRSAIRGKLDELGNTDGRSSAFTAFERLTQELLSDQGYRYPRSPAAYARIWEEAKKSIPDLVVHYASEPAKGLPKASLREACVSVLTT